MGDANTVQDKAPNFRNPDGQLFLIRCFACAPKRGRENYGPAVASGTCKWCGWQDIKTQPPAAKPTGGKWEATHEYLRDPDTNEVFAEYHGVEYENGNPIATGGDQHCKAEFTGADADLIVALRNAAVDINPDNPMAVAEGMVLLTNTFNEEIDWIKKHFLACRDCDGSVPGCKPEDDKDDCILRRSCTALDAVRAKPKEETP